MDLSIVIIDKNNRHLIQKKSFQSPFFRYFESRDETCLENHIITIAVLSKTNKLYGYGHIDYDGKDFWLGLYVDLNLRGKKLGTYLMKLLEQHAINNKIKKLSLTVDKINLAAINLYKKFDFEIIKDNNHAWKMQKNFFK